MIWWFGISEKEIDKTNTNVSGIIWWYSDIWITEFFVWYNPPYWYDKYWFEYSPNWRFWENEQITNFYTLKNSVEYIHSLKKNDWTPCEVYLTVNARYYTNNSMEIIKKIIDEAISINIDWLIIWNVETLEYLAEIQYKWKIHISTILSVYNQDDISFLYNFCKDTWLYLHRVILPREVTLKEIENLTSIFKDLDFEVFWQGDYCRYANWNCLAEHKYWENRDLCEVVLKQWMQVAKAIRYDFKTIIKNQSLSNIEKQQLLDNDIKYNEDWTINPRAIFISQNVSWSNTENTLIDDYLFKAETDNLTQDEIKIIYSQLRIDILLNYYKYIYDWLKDTNDVHNLFIKKIILLYNKIKDKVEKKYEEVETNMKVFTKIYTLAKEHFEKLRRERWWWEQEAYYRFLMYNRTSIPAYKFFNDINNISVVKIPLRWRHLSLFRLWIEMVDKAINNPEEFINIENISWKYFHYDLSELDIYKKYINELKTV